MTVTNQRLVLMGANEFSLEMSSVVSVAEMVTASVAKLTTTPPLIACMPLALAMALPLTLMRYWLPLTATGLEMVKFTAAQKSELQQDIDRVQSGCFGGATTLTEADLRSLAEKWLRQLR